MSIVGEDAEAWDAKKIAVERPTWVVTMSNEYVGYPSEILRIISDVGDGYGHEMLQDSVI